jgi:hypothetical protein
MYKDMRVMAENAKNLRLLALFSALEENDKDIVISMSEFLVERYKSNLTRITSNYSVDNKEHF